MSALVGESSSSLPAAPAPASAMPASQRIEELGRIIMAYSEVTEKLQQSHERLEQTVQTLRDELSEKNRMLERRNRLAALGEMAAGLAHEIRNPLGGIQLYASMLAKDVSDRPQSLSVVQKIAGGVRRLESLVSQVLQFTREMPVHVAQMDLAMVVEQAVELAAQQIATRQIRCDVTGPSPMPVQADPTLIGQVVLNLVLNAVEAMPPGGRLGIDFGPPLGAEAKQFRLIVRDSGPGIDPKNMDRIFNPFFTTKESGTGLGLAIVHRIIEAHDGTIIAANEPDAGGARFEVRV